MFNILSILAALHLTGTAIKEKAERPAPQGTRFDWDAYYKDINNGIGAMEQIKKRQRGGYNTTEPKDPEWWELPIDTVVDVERYEYDKKVYGETVTEINRKCGSYRCKRNF